MKSEKLRKYAELLVKTGINLKKNQILVVRIPVECADFARLISEVAFKEGARDVVLNWSDEVASKIRYLYGPDDLFNYFPSWQKEFYLSYVRQDAAFLSISASDPDVMKDVDPERIQRYSRVVSAEIEEYRTRMMNNENVWCVASVPAPSWAKKVFPELSEEMAVEKLWDAIFDAVRVNDEDPVMAWDVHKANLKKQMDLLNDHRFKSIHFTNDLGTDLHVELPEGHLWLGGSDLTPDGHEFIANMPTEEVFTAPKRDGVNGKVVSAMPLNFNGSLIEDFEIEFKEGAVVDFKAKTGYENLRRLIETDEGSKYLGEVALVPFDSPISNTGILFYNTLFDENAACHLALGKAYPVCIEGGEKLNSDELIKRGINDSITHEDFMIGTKDMKISGINKDGVEVLIFEHGNFVL
ncbi:MAG: aminopeptidase [Clostridia bacterium]|nr:aminopeptidase [Clostridia bacterium]